MYVPRRVIIGSLMFFAAVLEKFIRVALSMAIIPISAEYGWDKATEGLVLSAFFIGYTILQIFGGMAAGKFGGKTVFGLSISLGCPFVIAFPFCAQILALGVLCQFFCGLFHSFIYPSAYNLIALWFPKYEKGTFISVLNAGSVIGTITSWGLAPVIISNFGWQSLFYIAGGAGILWAVPWFLFTLDSPSSEGTTCFPVSPEELDYITSNQDKIAQGSGGASVPWKKLLSQPPMIVLTMVNFANNNGFYILMSWLPTYYKTSFEVDLQMVGIYSLLPNLFFPVILIVVGVCSEKLVQRKILSAITVRKICQSVSFGVPSTAFLLISYLDLSLEWTLVLVVFAVSFMGFSAGGYQPNFLDLSPKYVSSLVAFSNALGSLPGIFGVFLTGYILQVSDNDWSIVFTMTTSLYLFTLFLYLIFAKSDRIDLFEFEEDEQEYLLSGKNGRDNTSRTGTSDEKSDNISSSSSKNKNDTFI
eukprot:TRINITY_DN6612_c0_g1_i2.p1 TRINITY_DN6612_c0_g1~~TRINITY_DN6612_c0_g1_i2.p1  ORF type:complete len:474 (+),score=79.03 TRINITY_DN6612_c0_g1_i2:49-1470(+)